MEAAILRVDEFTELHPPGVELAGPLFRLIDAQRHYLRHWLEWVDGASGYDDMRKMILDAIRYRAGGQRCTFIIVFQGEVAGSVGFVRIDRSHRKAELGYWLSRNLQGRGIVTRCCRRLIDYAFNELMLNRIIIRAPKQNFPSQGVPRRLGFCHEGTLRQDNQLRGSFYDIELYSLLRKDLAVQ